MLLRILDYIKKEGCASNQQISRALLIEEDALWPMLIKLEERGLIIREGDRKPCKGCVRCDVEHLAYFSAAP